MTGSTITLAITVLFVLFCGLLGIHLIRLTLLSRMIRAEIEAVGRQREDMIKNTNATWAEISQIAYPDIDTSYRNLSFFKPWQRPSSLLVYDTKDA